MTSADSVRTARRRATAVDRLQLTREIGYVVCSTPTGAMVLLDADGRPTVWQFDSDATDAAQRLGI